MRPRSLFIVTIATALAAVGLAAQSAMANHDRNLPGTTPKSPIVRVKNSSFGYILQSKNRLPLYYWNVEQRAKGKIRCTGGCAAVWPPLIVKSKASVPTSLPKVRGKFGTIRRADGRLQVTFRGLPLYAYHNDPPNTVRCNNVDGWFVVRA